MAELTQFIADHDVVIGLGCMVLVLLAVLAAFQRGARKGPTR